ncbi:MAG: FtsQ-type POTRA domain-containing protein [Acidimicrobiia bacterium]|nr:FtsQ-type POTRA domain-containing protein [Acidimicrobiia bacterium]
MTSPVKEHAPAVDPRLRARRREIRRETGRRRLRRVQVGLGTVAVGAVGWGCCLSPLLDVDRVQVQGAEMSGADVVEKAGGIDRGEAMVTLKLSRVAAVVEALPWVATATVTRHWPGEVVVEVSERRPLAVVAGTDGSWVLVDGDGRQLAFADDGALPDLARIVGLDVEPQLGTTLGEAGAALELARLLPTALPGVVAQMAATDGGFEMTLAQRAGEATLVRFGDSARLAEKVDTLTALVDAGVLATSPPPSVIDVRVSDAPVLTRTGG